MGTLSVDIEVGSAISSRFVKARALVDTGATHTLLPRSILLEIAVEPSDRIPFELADRRTVEYEVGEARLRLNGRERTTLVVFGPEDAAPLLGATTLRLFNLAVDPVRQQLVPVHGLLK
jgi:aspartyl protease family protein